MEGELREVYLTDGYRKKIECLVEKQDKSLDEAVQLFLEECRNFDDLFKKDTPLSRVQEMAFRKMKDEL